MFIKPLSWISCDSTHLRHLKTVGGPWLMNRQLQYFVPGFEVHEVAWASNGGFCSEKYPHISEETSTTSHNVFRLFSFVTFVSSWFQKTSQPNCAIWSQTFPYTIQYVLIMKLFKDCVFQQRKFQVFWSCNMTSGAWLLPRTNDQPSAHELHRVIPVLYFND